MTAPTPQPTKTRTITSTSTSIRIEADCEDEIHIFIAGCKGSDRGRTVVMTERELSRILMEREW